MSRPILTRRLDPAISRTTAQAWRRRRDLFIALAWSAGASQRLIADVVGVSPSCVSGIVARVSREAESSLRRNRAEDGPYRVRVMTPRRKFAHRDPPYREDDPSPSGAG